MTADCFLGIDFGTSGVRAIAIDSDKHIQATSRCDYDQASASNPLENHMSTQDNLAATWRHALFEVIGHIPQPVRRRLRAIAINGTSGTVLWCDDQGMPVEPPILYNDDRGQSVMGLVRAIAPANHVVLSPTSSLSKLLWWSCKSLVTNPCNRASDDVSDSCTSAEPSNSAQLAFDQSIASIGEWNTSKRTLPSGYFLHQADWLAFLLHGVLGISDYHNSLKLGYDVEHLTYPAWMQQLPIGLTLPNVVAPGTPIAPIMPDLASQLELPAACQVCGGTTDSIAAFLASGVEEPGEAVTSLGSTLVIKLLSTVKVDDAQYGIYSHRLDHGISSVRWLVGGASNTGGSVLRQFFSENELESLSQHIDPAQGSRLDYYPLLKPGERFPVSDPSLMPRLSPRPQNDVQFLQGLLEGIAHVEAKGFQLLSTLGATPLRKVYTAGGGAKNLVWTTIRQQCLGVPVITSPQTEAAYGTACLALNGIARACQG